jgi:hypothetical protein
MPVPAGRPGRHSRHEKRRHDGQVFRPPVLGSVCRCDLIPVDDQDAIPRPAQGYRVVGEGILPLPRLAMIQL